MQKLISKAKLVSASKEILRKKESSHHVLTQIFSWFFSALLSDSPGIIMLAKLRKNQVRNMSICVQKATTTQLCGCSELADEAIASLTRIH